MAQKNSQLPNLAELTADKEIAFKNDQFNLLVNQPPPDNWIKSHPYIDGHRYLPIERVEYLLKRIFKRYRVEIRDEKMMMNSVVCRVRVHFLHPVYNEWDFHDGVGAAELQTKKDSGPLRMDMSNVNRGAVPMAAPTAESLAIKDACDKIGDLFGANLNRKDVQPYTQDLGLRAHETNRIIKLIEDLDTVEALEAFKKEVPEEFRDIITDKITWINNREEASK